MMPCKMSRTVPLLLLALLLALWVPATAAADTGLASVRSKIVAQLDALVRVEFVLRVKLEGASSDREIEGEVHCLLIDAEGMVLCSNTELGGYVGLMGRMVGGGRSMPGLSAQPSDLKVRLHGESQSYDGHVLTRDTDRDLVWVRIDPGERTEPFAFLDLETHATLGLGDPFYAVRRMGAFFGDEPLVAPGQVAAITRRPRRLLVAAVPINAGFGVPVFDADGLFVGITVLQMPAAEEAQGLFDNPMSFLGQTTDLQDMVGGLVLPAEELVKATQLAKTLMAEEAESEAETPSSEDGEP